MNSKIVYQTASQILCMLSVMAITIPIDIYFGSLITLFAVIWTNIGLFTISAKKIRLPIPKPNQIDMVTGFKILWWAAFWPSYWLRQKKK